MKQYKILQFETLESTNDYLKNHSFSKDYHTVVWALKQTKGRGRYGHTWESPKGNLYFSILLHGNKYLSNIFLIHIQTSVTLIRLLKHYGIEASIKFPNDIVFRRKKIAGILVETRLDEQDNHIILGVGLNVNQSDFKALEEKATSILKLTKKECDLKKVLKRFLTIFYSIELTNQTYQEYLKQSSLINQTIKYQGDIYLVKKITMEGKILLEKNGNEQLVSYENISLNSYY